MKLAGIPTWLCLTQPGIRHDPLFDHQDSFRGRMRYHLAGTERCGHRERTIPEGSPAPPTQVLAYNKKLLPVPDGLLGEVRAPLEQLPRGRQTRLILKDAKVRPGGQRAGQGAEFSRSKPRDSDMRGLKCV